MTLTFADLLELLGYEPDEHVSVCRQAPGQPFRADVVTAAAAAGIDLPPTTNLWFGVNPVDGGARGRGTVADVTRLAALYADLDAKQSGLQDFTTAHTVVSVLSELLGTRPSAITLSGNGLQPYWPLEDSVTGGDAVALLRRFGRLVRHVAQLHGGQVDSVYDLARVLRIPGSTNVKGDPKPVITLADSGHPLTAAEIDDALRAYGVEELPGDRDNTGSVVADPGRWRWASATCAYVEAMVASWQTSTPSARHPWLVSQFTRLACAHRLGCITEGDYAEACTRLTTRFDVLLGTGEKRRAQPGEIADAASWGVLCAAAKNDADVRAELGGHVHSDATLDLISGNTTGNAAANVTWNATRNVTGNLPESTFEEVAASTLLRSEDGHAHQLINTYADVIRHAPERGLWLTWNGSRWVWQAKGGGTVREYAKTVARGLPAADGSALAHKKRCLSSAGTSGCLKQAETDDRVTVTMRDLDADPYILNTPAGVVDLRTGRLHQPDPARLVTKTTAVSPAIDPDPLWAKFLGDTFPDDTLLGYIQRLVGMTLLGAVREQLLVFLHGQGANGKSTLVETLMHVLGVGETGYAIAAPAEMLMIRKHSEHPAELAQLAGARMVVCSELDDGQRFAEAKIKQLTGGDSINARFLYGQPFTFDPTHTIWLLGNHRPRAHTGGDAFWRRVKLVDVTHVVPEAQRDPALKDKLKMIGGTVLSWAIAGAVDYLRGGLQEPEIVSQATRAYAADQDTVGGFVADHVVRSAGYEGVSAVRAAYEEWCREVGEEPVSARRLTLELADRYGIESSKGAGGRRVYGGMTLLAGEGSDRSANGECWECF